MNAVSSSPTPRVGQAARTGAYYARHGALAAAALAVHARTRIARPHAEGPPPREALDVARERLLDLLRADLEAARRGDYPEDLLFPVPSPASLARLVTLLGDGARIRARRRRRRWRDLPEHVDLTAFPPYYRRTFHWQSDGYLSDRSAALYDAGVQLLFLGLADVMRRRVIPPIVDAVAEGPARPRILDVACGTGRTLAQLSAALPTAQLVGLDLSPWYVRHARRALADVPDLSLHVGAAEDLPFRDARFDVVTTTWLFHELPRPVRRAVVSELARVLRPGGRLVFMDAVQRHAADALGDVLDAFPRDFHEPWFLDWLDDPIEPLLEEAGLDLEGTQEAHVSRVVWARRPST